MSFSHFLRSHQIYYAGVSKKSGMNELIAIINATDKDFGANSTIELLITASYLFKYGATRSTGSLANSPFGEYIHPLIRSFSSRSYCSAFLILSPLFRGFSLCNFLCMLIFYHPTAISQDGRLTTNAFMAEYNQDRFELEIQAKETQPPERTTTAKVYVSFLYVCYFQAFLQLRVVQHRRMSFDEFY